MSDTHTGLSAVCLRCGTQVPATYNGERNWIVVLHACSAVRPGEDVTIRFNEDTNRDYDWEA